MMGKCRVYMICTFLTYLLFILMLHSQLELFDVTLNDTLAHGSVREKPVDTYKYIDTSRKHDTNKEDMANRVNTTITKYQQVVFQNRAQIEVTEKFMNFQKTKISHSQYEYPFTEECRKIEDTESPLNFRELFSMIYFYSAYYDDRPKENDEWEYIRLIALVKKQEHINLFCHFEVQGQIQNLNSKYIWTEVEYYEMCENHGKRFGGYILSCKVPIKKLKNKPCNVTISSVRPLNPTIPSLTIPIFSIHHKNMTRPKIDFGVCIPPIFGDQDISKIVQFIELTRILGASHFILYIAEIQEDLLQVLQYYEKLGIVTLIQWKMPVKSSLVWYNGQLLAINDCLYRSMRDFQYVIFNDLDEYLVPKSAENWGSMVKQIQHNITNTDDIAGFSFKSAFFPLGVMTSGKFHHLDRTQRVITLSSVRRKVMVNPRNIFELGIHHISRPFAMRHHGILVDEKYAILHHYRKCTGEFDHEMKCRRLMKDTTILKYATKLEENFNVRMNDFRSTLKNMSVSNDSPKVLSEPLPRAV